MKKIFTLLFFVAFLGAMKAQDVRFSQFYSNPLWLNPAMTGVLEGKYRFFGNYRTQFNSFAKGYRSYSLGGDFRLMGPKNDFWGIGGVFMADKAGTAGYRQMEFNISGSYQKMLGRPRAWRRGSKFLTIGAQIGFGQRGIDMASGQTSEQFNGDGFDPTLGSGETAIRGSKTYLDMNAGLMYYAVTGERRSFYAGAAVNHLAAPDISLIQGRREALPMRITAHMGGEFLLGNYRRSPLSLLPAFIAMSQASSLELTLGTGIKYRQSKGDVAFRTGFLLRNVADFVSAAPRPESIILNAGIEFGNITGGISYDINISSLKAVSQSNGAFEISIMYRNPATGKKAQGCPAWN